MGWLSIILGKSTIPSNIIEEIPPKPLFEVLVTYIYNSTESFFTQTSVIPKSLKDLWAHKPSRVIAKSMLYTLADITPLIIINAARNLFGDSLNRQASLLSIDGSLLFALEAITLAVNLYSIRSLLKGAITAICAPAAFHQADIVYPKISKNCEAECSSTFMLLNGFANETAAYYSNLAAIWGLNYVPYIGSPLSTIASTYASGRYIAGLTTSRCREHEYLKSEATLSLGLIHKGFEYLLWKSLDSSIGQPSFILMSILNQLPLLLAISIAAHQLKPPLVTREDRTLVDPIEMYENLTSFFFESACIGLKVKIKKLLSGPPSTIPWTKIGNKAIDLIQHPYLYNTRNFFLPKMLQNWDYFINEPMISPRWTTVQSELIKYCSILETASRSTVVNLANKSPAKAAFLFQYIFGLPKPVAKILLDIMGNDYYMAIINGLRQWLQLHEVKKDTGIAQLSKVIPLRVDENIQQALPLHILPNIEQNPAKTRIAPPIPQPDPNNFFRPKIEKKGEAIDVTKYIIGKKYQ